MFPLTPRRALVAALACGVVASSGASTASAATLAPGVSCARYIPQLAGQQWIPVSGTGFTPNTDPAINTIALNYADGDLAGFAPLAADGTFGTNVFMPNDFISSSAGRTKTYTLTAVDRQTPGLTASTQITLVRAGVDARPSNLRRNIGRKVRWSSYGAPTGTVLWMHWTFKGNLLARRKLGRAKGACGIARKRLPFVPVRPRFGTWKVFFTPGKRFSRRRALFRVDLNVFRTAGSGAATAASSVRR
jgi:hypothetical protein